MNNRLGKSLAALGCAFAVAFGGALAASTPSQAAPITRPQALVEAAPAKQAADYIVSQKASMDSAGALSDAIISLVGEGTHGSDVTALVAELKALGPTSLNDDDNVPAYGTAGRVIIALQAAGVDPATFWPGTDLYAITGSRVGGFPYQYSDSLAAAALLRAGKPVPSAILEPLLDPAYVASTDDFGGDPDTAALMVDVLSHMPGQAGAADQITRLLDAIAKKKQPEGYWTNYGPANTTGLVAPVMAYRGENVCAAVAWLKAQQALTGKGAFSNKLNGTAAQLYATVQAIRGYTGTTYMTVAGSKAANLAPVAVDPAAACVAATPTPTPTPTPTSTPTKPAPVLNEANACTKAGGVWVVIQNGTTLLKQDCAMGPTTAMDALAKISSVTTTKDTTFGPMLCSIDALPADGCDNASYWAFLTSAPAAAWEPAPVGAHEFVPRAGSMLAFVFGNQWPPAAKQVLAADVAFPVTPAAPTSSTPSPSESSSPKPSATAAAAPVPHEPASGALAATGSNSAVGLLALALITLGGTVVATSRKGT